MVFDLVDGGGDGGLCEELLEVLDRVIGHADGLHLIRLRLNKGLKLLPGLYVSCAVVDVAGAVFEFGKEGVVS